MACRKCGAPCQGSYCQACGRDLYRDTELDLSGHVDDTTAEQEGDGDE